MQPAKAVETTLVPIWNKRLGNYRPGRAVERPAPRTGQRSAGRSRLGASCGGHDQAHQAGTCRGPSGARLGNSREEAERERGTPKASGWFDNRTQR